MTPQDRFDVVKFGLVCGFVGPAVGLILLLFALQAWSLIQHGLEGFFPGNLLWIPFFYFFSLIFGAPGGIMLGALAAWLLIKKRERGAGPRALRAAGVTYGGLFGGMVMPFHFLVTASLIRGHAEFPFDLSHILGWITGILIGSITGAILGFLIALRLTRPSV